MSGMLNLRLRYSAAESRKERFNFERKIRQMSKVDRGTFVTKSDRLTIKC